MKRKIIGAIPFIIIAMIVLYSWVEFIVTEYVANWRHYLGLVLVVINGVFYFKNYKWAILITGITLVLATFNLVAFFVSIDVSWFNILGLSTPEMQLKSFGLFTIYFIINFNLLVNIYLDYKEAREKRKA